MELNYLLTTEKQNFFLIGVKIVQVIGNLGGAAVTKPKKRRQTEVRQRLFDERTIKLFYVDKNSYVEQILKIINKMMLQNDK